MIRKLQQWLSEQTKAEILTLGFAGAMVLFAIDLLGPPIGLSFFYFVPVCLTTWYAGRNVGLTVAVICTIARTAARELESPHHPYLWVPFWNVWA